MPVPQNVVTDYGFRVHAPGYITPAEARAWFEDLRSRVVALNGKPFGLLVDSRSQKANPPDTQELIKESMVWLRGHGMERSVVVLDSTVALIQILRLAKATGVYAYERYLDALKDPEWETKAVDWIARGIDPDLPQPAQKQAR
ncbi:MAG TPA: hypothetical protein VFZ09_49825 [Archangium sp.]|uniref:hypothetical protein n=1 Tax=Archangium sp. TaxID=1872627 RepID=UPI002E371450|nr:hypothetical protein [Archangium sp.]HEX5754382.1 hypothetical protein [Archangium sp.]